MRTGWGSPWLNLMPKGPLVNFVSFAFHPQINAGISAAGYSTPTPIQLRTIPPILAGRDVLGLAQTGTGKTAAFALPILQRLLKGPRGKLRALILSPTRELAEADRMFDMGFFPDIRRILAALPTPRQTLLFSATMPPEIRSLANEFLRRPGTVDLGASRPVETVSHAVYPVEQNRKVELLLAILRKA